MIKIIVLTMKSFLFSIASPGLGNVDGSIFSSLFAVSSFLNAKKKKEYDFYKCDYCGAEIEIKEKRAMKIMPVQKGEREKFMIS